MCVTPLEYVWVRPSTLLLWKLIKFKLLFVGKITGEGYVYINGKHCLTCLVDDQRCFMEIEVRDFYFLEGKN